MLTGAAGGLGQALRTRLAALCHCLRLSDIMPIRSLALNEEFRFFKRHETAQRKAQQALSRKIKFSHNWKKAKARVPNSPASATPAATTYIKPRPLSAKTTRWCVSRLAGTHMSKSQQAQQMHRAKRSGQVRSE
ncbi:hypothetical protein ACFOEM_14240 [Paenalcaligenes hominis]|uniref:hypothetical protein n=1 Tax=Paenalcaligenes hominis TaxID=643674 RepID=UPI00361BC41C